MSDIWKNCPIEIFYEIISKLDVASLLVCMQVNSVWKNIAYRVLQNQYGGLQNALLSSLEDQGQCYIQKAKVDANYLHLNLLLWNNISNSKIEFCGTVERKIKQAFVYKDKIIILDDIGLSYYRAENFDLISSVDSPNARVCDTYDENDYLTVMSKNTDSTLLIAIYPKERPGDIVLNLNNPYYAIGQEYTLNGQYCYVIMMNGRINCIRWYETRNWFDVRTIGRFFGPISLVAALHVTCDHDLYIMLTTGAILRCDTKNICPIQMFRLNIPSNDLNQLNVKPPIMMFHKLGAVINEQSNDNFNVRYSNTLDFWTIKCPGMLCGTDHGNVFFIGYKDGKIDIHLKKKLLQSNFVPERTINVYEYFDRPIYSTSRDIDLIDVYEAKGSHILHITTGSVLVRLSITDPELIHNSFDFENFNDVYNAVVHLIDIEECE